MRRYLNILLGALTMIAVALASAFVTMRLAIHGREVEVPQVDGLTIEEARALADNLGLNIDLENQFFSTTVPSGHILSQSPAPGTRVRRDWVLRVTESMGPQKVSIPDLVGKTEREASVTIRRLSLNLGTVAYIPSPGPAGIVLSQSPSPDAAGVMGPRISLLVSEAIPTPKPRVATFDEDPSTTQDSGITSSSVESASDFETSDGQQQAYVMPNLIGLTLSGATARVAAMNLSIASMDVVPAKVKPVSPVGSFSPSTSATAGPPSPLHPIAPIAPVTLVDTVIAQKPAAGDRITEKDKIHITLSH